MLDINKLFDTYNMNIEDKIKEAIKETKKQLNDLITEKTCMVYSSYLYNNLKKKNVTCNIMDTKEDYGMDYRHRFVVAKDKDNSYLIDLTFSQFGEDPILIDLLQNGYDIMSKEKFEIYLEKIMLSTKGKDNYKR